MLSIDHGDLTCTRLQSTLHLHDEAFAICSSMTCFVPTCAGQVQAELFKCKEQIVVLTRKAPPNHLKPAVQPFEHSQLTGKDVTGWPC